LHPKIKGPYSCYTIHRFHNNQIETTYTKRQREEGVPVHSGFWVDLRTVGVPLWERKGCLGAYVNLADQESLDAMSPRSRGRVKTKVQRHMYEETIYVLAGRGATTLWNDGMKKHTFEWQGGSLFALPLNCWYQHFNGQADQPIRYVGIATVPLCINLFHSQDFIYNNNFIFRDRFVPMGGLF
jgi:mannose-6-phosphate isomerase-like protein (cupin superfamily)